MLTPVSNVIGHLPRAIARAGCVYLLLALFLSAAHDPGLRMRTAMPAMPDAGANGLCQAANPTFRLGNAARPLGWSTAIADFNVDGAPDVAVADRVARGAAGYSYRIQFSISGQPSDSVTFESAIEAIQIRASDIDADNDLDLVASAVLSKAIVGVWLNDGHGRFSSSTVRALPAAMDARQGIDSNEPAGDPACFDQAPRRTDGRSAAFVRAPPIAVLVTRLAPYPEFRPCARFRAAAAGPRAPPSASQFLVS